MAKSDFNLGQWGETKAREYYEKLGYATVATNYHSRYGEIDLIMQKENLVVFVEVKTRKHRNFYAPLEAVSYAKQQKLILTAQVFVTENYSEHLHWRFDVMDIIFKNGMDCEINCIEGAFEL